MDLATLIGLVGSFAFIIMAMVLAGGLAIFMDTTSVLIVVGGSIFVVLMKFTVGQFFLALVKLQVKHLFLKQMNLLILL